MSRRRALGALLMLAGCAGDRLESRSLAVVAFCDATVETAGGDVVVDVETDYLPHVIACENGNAAPAALEAQAVSARSYLYYRLERTGSIGDGQGDQVYTCARAPGPEHVAAARATSGLILRYPGPEGTQVAAFYVAGALQEGPACTGGTNDPTSTERWVTYNEGRSGDDVIQTELGFVDPSNHANRGCMSQNGSHCLALEGRDVRSILRFYYGEDIGIEQAEGPCVEPVDEGGPDAGTGGGGGGDDLDDTDGCNAGGGASTGFCFLGSLLILGFFRPRSGRCAAGRRRLAPAAREPRGAIK